MAQEGSKMLLGLVDFGGKALAEFMDYQLSEDMFKEDELKLYKFVKGHVTKYQKLPDRKTVKKWGHEHSVNIPSKNALPEPPKYYLDGMLRRNLKLSLLAAMKEAEPHRQEQPEKSLALLTSSVIKLQNIERRQHLVNIAEDGERIILSEMLKTTNDPDAGVKFGWPTFDRMSGGLVGGDLISIVGRPGMGKTYMALHGMINVFRQKKTTLFVSMEMKNVPIVQRVAAMASHTSISELKAASVSSAQTKRMMDVLGAMRGDHGMWVVDGSLSATVEDIHLLCSQLKPDAVFIDGAYLLRHPNPRLQRHDKVNTNTELVKLLADDLNIPITQTFQFNREAAGKKSSEEVGLENIAGSDAIGQLSSAVLGLFQPENIETKLQKEVRLLKGRNGEQGGFTINWRFGGFGVKQNKDDHDVSNVMNFSEVSKDDIKKMNYH